MGLCGSKASVEAMTPKGDMGDDDELSNSGMQLKKKGKKVRSNENIYSSGEDLDKSENQKELKIQDIWDDSKAFSFMDSKIQQYVTTSSEFNSSNASTCDESQKLEQIDGYKTVRVLGHGSSSEVVEMVKDGVHYAVKICYIGNQTINFLNPDTHQPKEEAAILRNFNHPYVIKIFDIIDNRSTVLLVTELLVGGNILSIHDLYAQKVAFAQVVCALEYVHSKNIAHRDIKCENTLMDNEGTVKLCDFGISECIDVNAKLTSHLMKGTPTYCAPEVFSSNPYDLRIADIWSLGVTLYVMMFGKLPFVGKNIFDLEKTINSTEPMYPLDADPDLVVLLKGILTKDPTKRYTIADIWANPWMMGLEQTVKTRANQLLAKMKPTSSFNRKNSVRFVENSFPQASAED